MKRSHTGGEIQRAGLGRFRRASLPELRGGAQAYVLEGLGWTFLQATDTRRAQEDAAWEAYAADRTGQLRLM